MQMAWHGAQAWVHVHSYLDLVLAEAKRVLEPGGVVVVEDCAVCRIEMKGWCFLLSFQGLLFK